MLRLEQMTDGSNTVYKFEYIENGITIIKYFEDINGNKSIDYDKLEPVENGFIVEM